MNNLHRELAPISERGLGRHRGRGAAARSPARRRPPRGRPGRPGRRDAGGGRHRPPDRGRAPRARACRRAAASVAADRGDSGCRSRSAGRPWTTWSAGRRTPTGSRSRTPPRSIAFAEDRAVFEGYRGRGHRRIAGQLLQPGAHAARGRARLPDGRRAGAERAAAGRRRRPVHAAAVGRGLHRGRGDHRPRLPDPRAPGPGDLDGDIIWAPAIDGAFLLSTRGGDYELHLGQDLSIGYLSHDADNVELYFQESLTFLVQTTEAVVAIEPIP